MIWEHILNPGKINTYTSGCLKNQNRCWNMMGSLLLSGTKNTLPKFRSIISIVILLANTGRDTNSSAMVTKIDQIYTLCFIMLVLRWQKHVTVVVMLMALLRLEILARCNAKMAQSTATSSWAILEDRGGYIVHLVPHPFPYRHLITIIKSLGTSSHSDNALIRGNAKSLNVR